MCAECAMECVSRVCRFGCAQTTGTSMMKHLNSRSQMPSHGIRSISASSCSSGAEDSHFRCFRPRYQSWRPMRMTLRSTFLQMILSRGLDTIWPEHRCYREDSSSIKPKNIPLGLQKVLGQNISRHGTREYHKNLYVSLRNYFP